MERFDQPGEDAEPDTPHRAWPALRDDQFGATIEESKPDRWPPATPHASALSSASSPSAQLPGAGDEAWAWPSIAPNPQQTLDTAAQTGQHQFPEVERLAYPRLAHTRADPGRYAASATRPASASHATEPLPPKLRASGGDGPRWPPLAQPCAQRLQTAASGQAEDTQVRISCCRSINYRLIDIESWTGRDTRTATKTTGASQSGTLDGGPVTWTPPGVLGFARESSTLGGASIIKP